MILVDLSSFFAMSMRSIEPGFIDSIRGKEFSLRYSKNSPDENSSDFYLHGRWQAIVKGFYPHSDPSKNPVSNYCPHDFSRGQRKKDEFVVMKGVKFPKSPYEYNNTCETKINQLIEAGHAIEIEEGELLELIKNCAFSSPSQAASVILRVSANGVNDNSRDLTWRDIDN